MSISSLFSFLKRIITRSTSIWSLRVILLRETLVLWRCRASISWSHSSQWICKLTMEAQVTILWFKTARGFQLVVGRTTSSRCWCLSKMSECRGTHSLNCTISTSSTSTPTLRASSAAGDNLMQKLRGSAKACTIKIYPIIEKASVAGSSPSPTKRTGHKCYPTKPIYIGRPIS